MKKLRILLCFMFLLLAVNSFAANSEQTPAQEIETEQKGSSLDLKGLILGHMSDSYEWHICTWNDHAICIPLLVIVNSDYTGWHFFSSSKVSEDKRYDGFSVNSEDGKLYEEIAGVGMVKPIDISITKNVLEMWITVAILLIVFLYCARSYKNKEPGDEAPKGLVGMMEIMVTYIVNDVIRPSIGEKHYKFYTPYLLTVFFFILINNLLGLLPTFFGGANVTGNISVTFVLAMFTFFAINIFGNKHYWKEIFWPDVPLWLKFPLPIMPLIEFFGIFTKPFALMVRLFANMMSGHAIVLSLVSIIFITFEIGPALGSSLSVISVLMNIFMDCLELLVDFIQAYVFTLLSAVFIGLAHGEEAAE